MYVAACDGNIKPLNLADLQLFGNGLPDDTEKSIPGTIITELLASALPKDEISGELVK